jgi:molecular chaperone GrpE
MSRNTYDDEAVTPVATPEGIEASQNTDPSSDPASAVTTGVDVEDTKQPTNPISPQPSATQEELERLRGERDAAIERLARLQADFENTRKREARERSELRDYAMANAVEAFLPVLDNFQLALRSTGSAEQLRTGVELIVKQMEEALRSIAIQPIETVGSPFDPRFHEALEMVERDDVPDHQVIEEVRRGYRIKERLLRPALVRVASNSKQAQA